METLFLRTPLGNMEISGRRHDLSRWQRATLIVIGTGKNLGDLQHELRQMPEKLESILHALVEKGLVTPSSGHPTAPAAASATPDPLKAARRYLTYLIGIIENADANTALMLTLKLKKAATLNDIEAMHPVFLENLRGICGADEAQRLLEKLAV